MGGIEQSTCFNCGSLIHFEDRFCKNCNASNVTSFASNYSYKSKIHHIKSEETSFFKNEVLEEDNRQKTKSQMYITESEYKEALNRFTNEVKVNSPYRSVRKYIGGPFGIILANYNETIMAQPWNPVNVNTFQTSSRQAILNAFEHLIPYIEAYHDYPPSVRETDLEWAIKYFEQCKAADEFGEFDGIDLNIGVCYLLLFQINKAIKYVKQQLATHPEEPASLYSLALAYFMKEEFVKSIEIIEHQEIQTGLEIVPYFYRIKALVLKCLGQADEAKNMYNLFEEFGT